jgi:hypothetical protein
MPKAIPPPPPWLGVISWVLALNTLDTCFRRVSCSRWSYCLRFTSSVRILVHVHAHKWTL